VNNKKIYNKEEEEEKKILHSKQMEKGCFEATQKKYFFLSFFSLLTVVDLSIALSTHNVFYSFFFQLLSSST